MIPIEKGYGKNRMERDAWKKTWRGKKKTGKSTESNFLHIVLMNAVETPQKRSRELEVLIQRASASKWTNTKQLRYI